MYLTESQLYSLHSSGPSDREISRLAAKEYKKIMVLHMFYDHDMGVRQIAKRLGMKMRDVSAVTKASEESK